MERVNWHSRYVRQAAWTRALRLYVFEKAGLKRAGRVLEVGCGTGAVLATLDTPAALHGLDLDPGALAECRVHAPAAALVRGDAEHLPYLNGSFDISYCHFLLLWLRDPLQALAEMKRVTRTNGYVLALAEPDHEARRDGPDELAALGRWQTEALVRQGADPGLGARLADLFFSAGIRIVETGAIQSRGREAPALEERQEEWAVLENDLAGRLPPEEIGRLRRLDEIAWARGERLLEVPTYFAWGQV
jgi:SAM-dependent methyltransferase